MLLVEATAGPSSWVGRSARATALAKAPARARAAVARRKGRLFCRRARPPDGKGLCSMANSTQRSDPARCASSKRSARPGLPARSWKRTARVIEAAVRKGGNSTSPRSPDCLVKLWSSGSMGVFGPDGPHSLRRLSPGRKRGNSAERIPPLCGETGGEPFGPWPCRLRQMIDHETAAARLNPTSQHSCPPVPRGVGRTGRC